MSLIPDSRADTLPCVASVRTTECLTEDEVLLLRSRQGVNDARRHALIDHLDTCSTCLQLVMLAPEGEPSALREALDQATPVRAFVPGSTLAGRYFVRRFVARGGMGEVYEALDLKLNERVAIKTVVCTAGDSPRAVKKLFDEVQLARRIQHRHVCRIHELHEHRDVGDDCAAHFLTMEFVDGERLGQRIREQGPLELGVACQVARQLLLGLEAAHRARVLHLDFKSDNVMLRSAHTPPEAVIMDFGLSRAFDTEARLRTSERRELIGSMGYMSPEQIECRRTLGTGTDVYAFGVVLFEMLTGRLPFDGDSPVTIMLKRLKERPLPVSRFARVPPALDAFVLRCLSRDQRGRYRDASDALLAFDKAAATSPADVRRARLRRGALVASIATGFLGASAAVYQRVDQASTPPSTTLPLARALPPATAVLLAPALAPQPPMVDLSPATDEGRPSSTLSDPAPLNSAAQDAARATATIAAQPAQPAPLASPSPATPPPGPGSTSRSRPPLSAALPTAKPPSHGAAPSRNPAAADRVKALPGAPTRLL